MGAYRVQNINQLLASLVPARGLKYVASLPLQIVSAVLYLLFLILPYLTKWQWALIKVGQ